MLAMFTVLIRLRLNGYFAAESIQSNLLV